MDRKNWLVRQGIAVAWCPKCGYEYVRDQGLCGDCGVKLSDTMPVKMPPVYPAFAVMAANKAYALFQVAVAILVPVFLVYSIKVYISPELQNQLMPNPAFSIRDELPDHTVSFCIYNYVLLLINHILARRLPFLLKPRGKCMASVFRTYAVLNTLVFSYYFYIFWVYDPFNADEWHLFQND